MKSINSPNAIQKSLNEVPRLTHFYIIKLAGKFVAAAAASRIKSSARSSWNKSNARRAHTILNKSSLSAEHFTLTRNAERERLENKSAHCSLHDVRHQEYLDVALCLHDKRAVRRCLKVHPFYQTMLTRHLNHLYSP